MTTKLSFRDETRIERYLKKQSKAQTLPAYLSTIYFIHDENLGLLIRAIACFGLKGLFVIGHLPSRKILRATSGSTSDFVEIRNFKNPSEFLAFTRDNNMNVFSLEMSERSKSILDFDFPKEKDSVFVIGNESYGVPEEILLNTHHISIPMNGIGYNLNAAQAGTILSWELSKTLS